MTHTAHQSALFEPSELRGMLDSGQTIKILDASHALPGGADPREAFVQKRLKSACYFSIEEVSDHASPLPHMLPSVGDFGVKCTEMGLSNDDLIVIYGQDSMAMGPARAWWMFRVFGHDRVCVLDGGLKAWEQAGFPVESGPVGAPAPAAAPFQAVLRPELVADMKQVERVMQDHTMPILDARPQARFTGHQKEPRPGLSAGHIPGSHNIPANSLLDPQSGKMKNLQELQEIFKNQGINPANPALATCGSGVTACMISLAMFQLGNRNVAVYDGSWAEWGQDGRKMPVERE